MVTRLEMLKFILLKTSSASPARARANQINTGQSPHDPPSQGFTLTELLIVVIIGGLIVSTLMALVVQLVSTEQRESARTETQREMQLALDYVASDLRQAVYVYDGSPHPVAAANSTPSYLKFLPTKYQDGNNYRPVLAFWKPTPVDPSTAGIPAYSQPTDTGGCNGAYAETNAKRRECNNLWLQRRTYSLVVYFEVPRKAATNPNDIWKGQSRIERYELSKYSNISNFTRNVGYVDPGELGAGGFASWPYSGTTNCQAADCGASTPAAGTPTNATGSVATLIDFVDTSQVLGTRGDKVRAQERDSCPTSYLIQPATNANYPDPSFFMCIRDSRPAAVVGASDVVSNDVQDIQIYLRGNAGGQGRLAGDIPLSSMETRLTMRGVIDKQVNR